MKNLFLILVSVLPLISCSSKETQMEQPIIESNAQRVAEPPAVATKSVEAMELANAFFDYDKAVLKPEAKKALRQNAAWLKKNPSAKLQIEGQCDERGTKEYNLKLGKRRAEAAKHFLTSLGVAADRITTVSYGAVQGADYDKNRRAGFVIILSGS